MTSPSKSRVPHGQTVSEMEQIDQMCDRFEAAWRAGTPLEIENAVPASWPGERPAAYRRLLTELVIVDMQWRWKSPVPDEVESLPAVANSDEKTLDWSGGLPPCPPVETYLRRFPALGTAENVAIQLIAEEYRLRRQRGQDVDMADFLTRFPGRDHEIASKLAWLADVLDEERRRSTRDSDDPSSSHGEGIRYRKLRQVGEGGLGEVSLARDTELNRKVALKEIKSQYADSSEFRTRFLLEAEVTGRLEHPGIVPVYGLGFYADGRPFYAMRYVRGESFWTAIRRFHDPSSPSTTVGERMLLLQQLLRRFLDICNAVEYAHSRGVIHRDLKPANVMLGHHGETLVIDWGLVKLMHVAQAEDTPEESILTATPSNDPLSTQPGSAVGTPAYMSPEQAGGDLDRLGRTSDVYSLGAILYCLLTGGPPFHGKRSRIREMILKGDFPRPSEVKSDTPPPLQAICLKAMSVAPEARYQSCKAMADDIEKWLADEAVSAHQESRRERLARWIRHNHSRVQTVGVSLVVIALISIMATILIARAWNAETRAKELATRSKQQAVQRFVQARDAVDTWLTGTSEVLTFYPGTIPMRERLLQMAAEDYEWFVVQKSDDPDLEIERGRTYLRLGHARLLMNDHQRASESYHRAEELFEELGRKYPDRVVCQVELANCRTNQGLVFAKRGKFSEADQAYQDSIRRLSTLADIQTDPDFARESLVATLLNRGELLAENGDLDQAESLLRRCLEILKGFSGQTTGRLSHQPALANVRNLLGIVLMKKGDCRQAVNEIQSSVQATGALLNLEPDNPRYLRSRADSNVYLGSVLRPLGRHNEAANAYRQALMDYGQLGKAMPGVPEFEESLAITHVDLAHLLYLFGEVEDVSGQLDSAEEILHKLLRDSPDSPGYLDKLAYLLHVRGEILRDLGRLVEARETLERAIGIYEALSSSSSADGDEEAAVQYRSNLGICRANLALTMHFAGQDEQAEQAFVASLKELSGSTAPAPHDLDNLAVVNQRYGLFLHQQGRQEAAREAWGRSEKLWSGLISSGLAAPEHRNHYARMLILCPDIGLAGPTVAIELSKGLTSETPDNANYRNTLGAAYCRAKRWPEAVESLQEAIRQRSGDHASDWFLLAIAKVGNNQLPDARRDYERGVAWMEKNLPYNFELQQLLHETAGVLQVTAPKFPPAARNDEPADSGPEGVDRSVR